MTMRSGYNMHRPELQEFLFAPIWIEKNGTPLSILSALARLGMDPWGEATRLANLPRAGAASALAAILARLPRNESELPDYAELSQHLVQFLPEGGSTSSTNQPENGRTDSIAKLADVQKLMLILGLSVVLIILQVNGWLF
jgi:hypothetical protein